MPLFLLMLFSLAFAVGFGMVLIVLRQPKYRLKRQGRANRLEEAVPELPVYSRRPSAWLAVKSRSIEKVRAALKLQNAHPCPVVEGLTGDMNVFIAPPVKGWILVTGCGLPEPDDDPDACFLFLAGLSRELGEVQFFSANPVVQHHAWARLVRGKVERAFAWAGETVWLQGRLTPAERALAVVCPAYGEELEKTFDTAQDFPGANVEKVPLLAARWSLDPATLEPCELEQRSGIAGEWSHRG